MLIVWMNYQNKEENVILRLKQIFMATTSLHQNKTVWLFAFSV